MTRVKPSSAILLTMKNILKEFKEFAVKGDMIDISVGIVIGAAFNDVVNVIVTEIILPPISFLTDGINLENRALILRPAGSIDGRLPLEDIAIGYGKMLEVSIDFLIIGMVVFTVIKAMNILRRKKDKDCEHEEKTPKNIKLMEKTVELLEEQNRLLQEKSQKSPKTISKK